ncbi:MAG: hypothetical protein HOP10_03025 [Chitinophagaceae bacterium]|nr:hypothetical protein [Chitinophagaceae bacterium]
MNKIIISLITMVFIWSCRQQESRHCPTVEEVKKMLQKSPTRVEYNKNRGIRSIYNFDADRGFGNVFEFDSTGRLVAHSFRTESNLATYVQKIDPNTCQLNNQVGMPLVGFTADFDRHSDSLYVEYYISDFLYDKLELAVSFDGKLFKPLHLNKHAKIKFFYTANLVYHIRSLSRVFILARIKAKRQMEHQNRIYMDTIDLTRRKMD